MTPEVQLTEHGIPIRNVWHMLLYVWEQPPEWSRWQGEIEQSPTLDALLTNVLCQQMEQRLRIGLGREYVDTNERIRGIKGRIDFTRSLLNRTFERGEAYCRYSDFKADAPRNQIIRSVLARVLRIGEFGPDNHTAEHLKQRIRKVLLHLDEVSDIQIDLSFIRRQNLGRNDGDYRLMLAICEFLLEEAVPTEAQGEHVSLNLERNEGMLHRIFEKFVAMFYRYHLPDWRPRRHLKLTWPAAETSSRLPIMEPDLTLRSPQTKKRIVLDTKFTAKSLTAAHRSETERYDAVHLYQMYAYLRTQELPAVTEPAAGILLYPTVGDNISDIHHIQGHELHISTVDLAAQWQEIEHQLLNLVTQADGGAATATSGQHER